MVARTPSHGSRALQLAVANLLRLAQGDLADARLLLREGELRNVAVIGNQCLHHLVLALAASEHGWPLEGWQVDLHSLPDANPLLGELTAIDGLIMDALGPRVLADGGSASAPDTVPIHGVLDQLAAALDALSKAFGVDGDGTRPAERVHALRSAPPEPKARPSGGRSAPRTRDARTKGRGHDGRRDTEDAWQPEADPKPDQRQALAAPSTAFWSLMDQWQVPDLDALRLVGHPGGLTKPGARPRFKLGGTEAELFGYFAELDTALRTLGLDPAEWLGKPIREAPFKGATPLAHISRNGVEGARDVARRVLEAGLRQAP